MEAMLTLIIFRRISILADLSGLLLWSSGASMTFPPDVGPTSARWR